MPTTSPARVFAIVIAVLLVGAVLTVAYYLTVLFLTGNEPEQIREITRRFQPSSDLRTFASCRALENRIADYQSERGNRGGDMGDVVFGLGAPTSSVQKESADYSTTNVQVEGVDEADLVKADGSYLYTVSHGSLSILATPADGATLVSQTDLDFTPQELFVGRDDIVVFGSSYRDTRLEQEDTGTVQPSRLLPPDISTGAFTVAQLWDVRDRSKPVLRRTIEFEGTYQTSRLIDNDVYLVLNTPPRYNAEDEQILPLYRDEVIGGTYGAYQPVVGCADVSYADAIAPEQFITVASFEINDPDSDVQKEVVLGSAQNVYASERKLYVAGSTSGGSFFLFDLPSGDETTNVQVFDLDNGRIEHQGSMDVPGHLLNQFSMDEYQDVFRVATTIGEVSRDGAGTSNNVYLYNANLDQIGALEDLAPGEKIYAARFLGARAYLVTFQKVDPLFALDLSDPRNPKVLGKLKIPGYSDYLHPYDDTHLIGVGKEAVAAEEGDFAWYQGLKVALFDVTDPANPKQLHNVIIGDRGSDSTVLNDHKAFLFSRERNLLVFPVLLAEIPDAVKQATDEPTTYGDFTFQGAYVYTLTLERGFEQRGRITHVTDDQSFLKSGYRYYGDGSAVTRSVYVGDRLYTISMNAVLANRLDDALTSLNRVDLCTGEACTTSPYAIY
ncbi:MAG: beta-propeller domain-containing protein [Candidatus Kerfeldbacteria bacterium]|nr:beta-propeller domain-containing protein [Candidatus Kerfeldbacteria bacterium]